MTSNDRKRIFRKDLLLASVMVAAGLAISAVSLTQLRADDYPDGAGEPAVAVVT